MKKEELLNNIRLKKSFLCVGLDVDLDKIPKFLLDFEDPVFEFNKRIIDATKDYTIAYKPNIAFYECLGSKGWDALKKTVDYIPDNIFTIADAKRGDIGNTSKKYAETFFEYLNFDAVTVAPYMGVDSVTPFLEYEDKWVILLGLTSNKGALDFQFSTDLNGEKLYEKVIKKSMEWGEDDRLMYVVGATRGESIKSVRDISKKHFFLVPGIGAQGGSLSDVAEFGWNDQCGLIVNSSRGIIYAGNDQDFDVKAKEAAQAIQSEMSIIIDDKIKLGLF
ncbi:orotidine-5'-phosphate decarboxylase [Crocinitomix catalasitica]|uniref:orotidine-5'-phosphate decarboxylase n=1 Tax=Crocinitomix catalasitica TaxID=184607 RepID=UPI0004890043|nr:orotidine-5'-phosphate decarboxylase [Crocinitomix catalasitica]